nr:uncharacterized protein LOC127483496 [Oryctolagus cuniculus]
MPASGGQADVTWSAIYRLCVSEEKPPPWVGRSGQPQGCAKPRAPSLANPRSLLVRTKDSAFLLETAQLQGTSLSQQHGLPLGPGPLLGTLPHWMPVLSPDQSGGNGRGIGAGWGRDRGRDSGGDSPEPSQWGKLHTEMPKHECAWDVPGTGCREEGGHQRLRKPGQPGQPERPLGWVGRTGRSGAELALRPRPLRPSASELFFPVLTCGCSVPIQRVPVIHAHIFFSLCRNGTGVQASSGFSAGNGFLITTRRKGPHSQCTRTHTRTCAPGQSPCSVLTSWRNRGVEESGEAQVGRARVQSVPTPAPWTRRSCL